jgi:hypothetical protein
VRVALIIAALLDQIENCFVVREESRSNRVMVDEYDMRKKESGGNVNGATWVKDFHGVKSLLDESEEAAALEPEIGVLSVILTNRALAAIHSSFVDGFILPG